MPLERFADVPCPTPLAIAVEHGVFGWEVTGPISPDNEEVRSLTEEHACHMLAILEGRQWLEQCRERNFDPQTGVVPQGKAGRKRASSMSADIELLTQDYDDLIAVYSNAFGDSAAAILDQYVHAHLAITRVAMQQVLFPL